MKLKGNDFFLKTNSKIYDIIICDSNNNINIMINHMNKLIENDEEIIIGIDFEFNRSLDNTRREIALCQLNLETISNQAYIFMFYPPDLNDKDIIIVKNILLNHKNKKIIHGGESLDIPYLFTEFFIDNDEKNKFCKNLFDTKYLCEFYNASNNLLENKCKIYKLLLQMKIINQKQFDYLIENEEKMGPIYNIRINVKSMSDELINYSAYDVLYLPELYKSFPNNYDYQKLIPEITSIHFILKQTDFFTKYFQEISKFNLNFVIFDNKYFLSNIYEFVYQWINVGKRTNYFNITYFKKFFTIIIKYIVYNTVIKNFKTYHKKDILNHYYPTNLNNLLEPIKSFSNIIEFIKNINNEIKNTLIL